MKHSQPRSVLLLAGVMGAAACANGALPQRSAQHPGHPSAPEGYTRIELAVVEDGERGRATLLGAQPEATRYVCPMHPEVVSSTPGNCSKCGMKLVPQPSPPKQNTPATP